MKKNIVLIVLLIVLNKFNYSQVTDTIPNSDLELSKDSCKFYKDGVPFTGYTKIDKGFKQYYNGALIKEYVKYTHKKNDSLELESEMIILDNNQFFQIKNTTINLNTNKVYKTESILGVGESYCESFSNVFGSSNIVFHAIYDGEGNLYEVNYENEKGDYYKLHECEEP